MKRSGSTAEQGACQVVVNANANILKIFFRNTQREISSPNQTWKLFNYSNIAKKIICI